MNTLTQPEIGLSSRLSKGKDLRLTRQGGLTNVDPQHLMRLEREPNYNYETSERFRGQGSFAVRLVIRQSPFEASSFGLVEALEGYRGLSAFIEYCIQPEKVEAARPMSYLKNGILVHHSGTRITSDDVAKALAEE